MKKTYALALHIFRRDLRLNDNAALIAALQAAERVIPCFIFDPRQIDKNDYKSEHCLQFMAHSLHELAENLQQRQGKLYYFYGIAEEVIAGLTETLPIDAVYFNRDYTPFSIERDRRIRQHCAKQNIAVHCYSDALLHEPEEIHKTNGEPYTVYTHFYNKAKTLEVAAPQTNHYKNYYVEETPSSNGQQTLTKLLQKSKTNIALHGGRKEALSLLKKISTLANYAETRNYPALDSTTHLSAHNKFGTVSIREVYSTIVAVFGREHTLIKELYWRDFFTHIAFHYPRVLGEAFHPQYNHLIWRNDPQQFQCWCEGRTGFPIVDAGMRELNTTGYMHNRVRMIVASFLTKDLLIDWRWGEKYFAQQLIDYDPAVNNGNWQWSASTGCDAQPYFRIFNPWLQQQKFDPDGLYIKRWIPELARVPASLLHTYYQTQTPFNNYPHPIVDHGHASTEAKLFFKKLSR